MCERLLFSAGFLRSASLRRHVVNSCTPDRIAPAKWMVGSWLRRGHGAFNCETFIEWNFNTASVREPT